MRLKSKRIMLPLGILVLIAACGSVQGGRVSGDFPKFLKSIPRVGVTIDHASFLPWMKERGEKVEQELRACLPGVLDRFCGSEGCAYIFGPGDPEASMQKNLLTVKIGYTRSAHFMDGFALAAYYEMKDPPGLETILKYRYKWEPETKIYYEEGMDRDEVFTPEAAETAEKFCEDLARELKNFK